ncbi:MAG: heme transport system substrate-binding protein [Blastocatellia bacterium]|jgi:iron complex transport system substrate-binding protein|nr:heme transport system substrate-binding protein [Blastocatellia bacterium]
MKAAALSFLKIAFGLLMRQRNQTRFTNARSLFALFLVIFCLASLPACRQPSSNKTAGITVNDAEGKGVTINDSSRVVSIGTATTETIYALGLGSRLVGVDNSSSDYLKETSGLPKTRPRTTLSAEGILALNPSLVILPTDAGPPQVVDQLRNTGVTVFSLSANYTVEAVKEKVRAIARALGVDAKGAELSDSIDRDMSEVGNLLARTRSKPRVLFIGRGPNMPNATMSGKGTTIDEMIRLAGGTNPMDGFQGFREMTDEAVINAAPDVILMTEGSFERSGGVDGVLKFPGVALTPAGKARRIVAVSDIYFQGFGPSVGRAVQDLVRKLHPELSVTENVKSPVSVSDGERK